MKKHNKMIIVVVALLIVIGCSNKSTNKPVDSSVVDSSAVTSSPAPDIVEQSPQGNSEPSSENEGSADPATLAWFEEGTFEFLSDRNGQSFKLNRTQLDQEQLKDWIKASLSYSNWELFAHNKAINYTYEDIGYYQNPGSKDVQYFDFSKDFGDSLFYESFSDGSMSILMDYQHNQLFFLEYGNEEKKIMSSFQMNDQFPLSEVRFIGGYKAADDYHAVFYVNSTLYELDTQSLKVIHQKQMDNVTLINGYSAIESESEQENFYVYFLDESSKTILKYGLIQNDIVLQKPLNAQIDGQIQEIEYDGYGGRYILTQRDEQSLLYFEREDDSSFLLRKEADENGNPLEPIGGMQYYVQNQQNLPLILFNPKEAIPVSEINSLDATWVELN